MYEMCNPPSPKIPVENGVYLKEIHPVEQKIQPKCQNDFFIIKAYGAIVLIKRRQKKITRFCMIHSFDPLDGFLCNKVHSVENWMLNTVRRDLW